MTKSKISVQLKITTIAKATVFCLVAGMLAGFLRGFDFLGESLKMLLPGLLFGIALPIANWQFYKRPWLTLLGFAIISTAIYPMIVVLALRFFGEEMGSDLVNKVPYSLGILPSLAGAGLLYFVYKIFLGKQNSRFLIVYLSIAIFVGILFFPLMNFANNFVLSLGIWQAGIGFGLTYLHFGD
jgi:hypothetical protein